MHVVHVARVGEAHSIRGVTLSAATLTGYTDTLFATLPRRFDTEHAAGLIYETPARIRKLADHLVIRAHRYEAEALLVRESIGAAKLIDRFRRLPIWLLHWSDGYRVDTLNGEPPSAGARNELLAALPEAELRAFAREPGALLPASSTFHYAAPNGKHYRSFLRVGTALQSQDALDAVAFWLLPHLEHDTVVVLDSPTVLAIGLNLARYLTDLDLRDLSIRAIDTYRGAAADLRKLKTRLSLVQPRIERRRHALVISSVSSSGSLLHRLESMTHELGFNSVRSVALYADDAIETSPPGATLARLPTGILSPQPRGACKSCTGSQAEPSVALRISPVTFHMEIAQAVSHARITQRHAKSGADFLAKYGSCGAVSAHRTEKGGHGRHHAVYVDGGALLRSDAFTAAFIAKVAQLRGRVTAILHPVHESATALARVAGQILGMVPVSCDEDRLGDLAESDRERINASDSILIVDDVAITGDRIRGYRQFLIEAGRSEGDVHVLLALARPNSSDGLQGLRNLVNQMNEDERTFHAVETVLLPDWENEDCPWCREADWLERFGQDSAHLMSGQLLERMDVLRRRWQGLTSELFWSWDGMPFILGGGSVFAPADATQSELFFSVAAAIQSLRSEGELDEDFVPPISKLLKHEFWARGRFYAPAITAAILRACRPHDLMPPVPKPQLASAVSARLRERASHSIRTELLLAIAQRKLPTTPTSANILTRKGAEQPMRDFLLAASQYSIQDAIRASERR